MLPVRHASSRPRSRARLAATGAAVLVLVAGLLTGCGSDGAEPEVAPAPPAAITVDPDAVPDGEQVPSPAPDEAAASEAEPSEEPAEEPAEEPSETPEAAPEADASAAPEEDGPADCATLQAAWNQTNQALVNLSADHPRALVNSFRVAGDAMAGVEAPEAIAGPWKTMSGYLVRVNDGLELVDADDATAVAAAMAAAVTAADTQAATAAGQKITAFVGGGCQS